MLELTRENSGEVDASVLNRLFAGELTASSIVEETENGAQIALGEHAHYSSILKIARIASGLSLMADEQLLAGRPADWTEDLKSRPFSSTAYKIFKNHETGFLSVEHRGRSRIIAISAGLPIASTSNLKSEQFGQFLLDRGVVTEEQSADLKELCLREQASLGWGLLNRGLVDVARLEKLLEEHARMRILPIFSWQYGKVAFFRDERAAQLTPIINLPLMEIVRNGIWRQLPKDFPTVEKVTKNLTSVKKAMRVSGSLGALSWELTDLERHIHERASEGATVEDLISSFKTPEKKSECLRSIFSLAQMGVIHFDGNYQPDLHIATTPVAYTHRDRSQGPTGKSTDQLEEYKLRKQLEDEGRSLFFAHDYRNSAKKFQLLADRQEQATDALAYLAVATLMINPSRYGKRALNLAHQSVSIAEGNALAHASMSRIYDSLGQGAMSERHRKRSLQLAEHNPQWLAEVHVLLGTAERLRQEEQREPAAEGPIYVVVFALIATLFFLSNIIGLGSQEYFYEYQDQFFWGRRIALLGVGLIAISYYFGTNPFQAIARMGWKTHVKWILIALVWGLIIGNYSPIQRVTGSLEMVMGMTLFHVLVEEIFFRGMLTRILLDRAKPTLVAIFASAIIFGLYHVTYYTWWYDATMWMKFYWICMITFFAGLPYAALYYKSGSMLPPTLAHLCCNVTMMWLSFGSI
ncbi:MAG: CPBP family intramembrane glutamic endopeptidase [Myxococcota bacterium]|nr:CPBP family intramembrane glutamic endopeptidase [Myxococcota bacterium]